MPAVQSIDKKRKRTDAGASKKIPITVLSGFLGAGKTTLTNHILSKCENIAVIVNDMSAVNIDAKLIRRTTEQMIELTNGCICCTLRKDLLDTIQELVRGVAVSDDSKATSKAKTSSSSSSSSSSSRRLPKAILIESTGISEPVHVAETFAYCEEVENGVGLSEKVYIDAMITVVDCRSFFDFFKGSDAAAGGASSARVSGVPLPEYVRCTSKPGHEHEHSHGEQSTDSAGASAGASASGATAPPPEGERTITDLFIDQIQFANIVVLNKVDLCSLPQPPPTNNTAAGTVAGASTPNIELIRDVTAVVRHLNPYAKLFQASFGAINPRLLMNTSLYKFDEILDQHEYFAREWEDTVPETEEYGISSIVFKAKKPFHPRRLAHLLYGRKFEGGTAEQRCKLDAYHSSFRAQVVRAKGFMWLPTALGSECFVVIHMAGSVDSIRLTKGAQWWCNKLDRETLDRVAAATAAEEAADAGGAAAATTGDDAEGEGESGDESSSGSDESDDEDSDDGSGSETGSEDEEDEELDDEGGAGGDVEFKREVIASMDATFGDRGQTLVVIGLHLDKALMEEAFNYCLLTDEEMKRVRITDAELVTEAAPAGTAADVSMPSWSGKRIEFPLDGAEEGAEASSLEDVLTVIR